MTKRKKLKEIYKYCEEIVNYWECDFLKRIRVGDLIHIMNLIDEKKTEKILNEINDNYNGLTRNIWEEIGDKERWKK